MWPLRRRPGDAKEAIAALAALQAEAAAAIRDGSETDFAETARAMHLGEIEPRPVHGQASADAGAFADRRGVPIAPLPLPVVPPSQVN